MNRIATVIDILSALARWSGAGGAKVTPETVAPLAVTIVDLLAAIEHLAVAIAELAAALEKLGPQPRSAPE